MVEAIAVIDTDDVVDFQKNSARCLVEGLGGASKALKITIYNLNGHFRRFFIHYLL